MRGSAFCDGGQLKRGEVGHNLSTSVSKMVTIIRGYQTLMSHVLSKQTVRYLVSDTIESSVSLSCSLSDSTGVQHLLAQTSSIEAHTSVELVWGCSMLRCTASKSVFTYRLRSAREFNA